MNHYWHDGYRTGRKSARTRTRRNEFTAGQQCDEFREDSVSWFGVQPQYPSAVCVRVEFLFAFVMSGFLMFECLCVCVLGESPSRSTVLWPPPISITQWPHWLKLAYVPWAFPPWCSVRLQIKSKIISLLLVEGWRKRGGVLRVRRGARVVGLSCRRNHGLSGSLLVH